MKVMTGLRPVEKNSTQVPSHVKAMTTDHQNTNHSLQYVEEVLDLSRSDKGSYEAGNRIGPHKAGQL